MKRVVLSCLFAAVLAVAVYSYLAIGHCYPALGVAAVAGALIAWINPLASRHRTPRMASLLILVGGFWVSHQFPGVPDKGPHRLAYDVQYLAILLIAIGLFRRAERNLRARLSR